MNLHEITTDVSQGDMLFFTLKRLLRNLTWRELEGGIFAYRDLYYALNLRSEESSQNKINF